MQVYKTKWFSRFARREEISEKALRNAIERAQRGLIDANLGDGLMKQRVARSGQGRSSGYRAIIAYRIGHRAVFIYGLAKSDRENFAKDELETAREIGSLWISANPERIARGIRDGELVEVSYGHEEAE